MAVLVTGGAGFVGSYVVRRLAERGEQVVLLYHVSRPRMDYSQYGDRVSAVRGDVARIEEILAPVQHYKVSHIIHMAAATSNGVEAYPLATLQTSVVGFGNVLEVARWTGVERVVYASSTQANGEQGIYGERPVTEDDRPTPINLYGCTKMINEMTAKLYTERFGLDTRGLRFAHATGYGRGGRMGGWGDTVVSGPALGQYHVEIPYSEDTKSAYIYVEDVAEYLVRLAFTPNLSKLVYVSGGHTATCREETALVQKFIPEATYTFKPVEYPHIYMVDNAALVRDTGHQIRSMEQSIRDHIDEARRQAGLPPL